MDDDRCANTAEVVADVVLEVRLDHPHVATEAGHDLRGQSAFAATLDLDEICGLEAAFGVPHVDVRLPFVSEENTRAIVGAEKDDLKAVRFWSHVNNCSRPCALPEMLGLD